MILLEQEEVFKAVEKLVKAGKTILIVESRRLREDITIL